MTKYHNSMVLKSKLGDHFITRITFLFGHSVWSRQMLILWMLSIRIVCLTQQYQTYVNEKLLDWHFQLSYASFTEQRTGTNSCTDGFLMLCGNIHSCPGPRRKQGQGPVLVPNGSQSHVSSGSDAGIRFWSTCSIPHLFLVWVCVNAFRKNRGQSGSLSQS